jgi:hypothetical protein
MPREAKSVRTFGAAKRDLGKHKVDQIIHTSSHDWPPVPLPLLEQKRWPLRHRVVSMRFELANRMIFGKVAKVGKIKAGSRILS